MNTKFECVMQNIYLFNFEVKVLIHKTKFSFNSEFCTLFNLKIEIGQFTNSISLQNLVFKWRKIR